MFDVFRAHFRADQYQSLSRCTVNFRNAQHNLAADLGGISFNRGIFRLVTDDRKSIWAARVSEMFPRYARVVVPFSYDWMGRCFAFRENNVSQVLMFEPGSAAVLEVPVSLDKFLDEELVHYSDASLAYDLFKKWSLVHSDPISPDDCVGFRVPLFLGGSEEISNLQLIDIDVYWSIHSQIWNSR